MVEFQENPSPDTVLPHIRGNDKVVIKVFCLTIYVEQKRVYLVLLSSLNKQLMKPGITHNLKIFD